MASSRNQLNAERSEATRARLLQAARDVFERRGYAAASVSDVVAAAGVARGTFYVHFATKREVFVAVVHDVRADLVAGQMRPLTGSRTVGDAIRNGIEQYLRAYRTSARMINLIEEVSISDASVRAAWNETREALQVNTRHALERLKERGLADYDGDVRIVALAIGAMVERMGTLRYVLGEPFEDEPFYAGLTRAYLNAARIVGEYQLEPRESGLVGVIGSVPDATTARQRPD
jgi:AcrR family transcriptional regulator